MNLHKNTNLNPKKMKKSKKSVADTADTVSELPTKDCSPKSIDNKDFEFEINGTKDLTGSADIVDLDSVEVENIINEACNIHEELCDACFITEDYFSVVMLTIITIGFLIIVFNAYYVLEVAFRHNGNVDTETQSFIIFLVYQMFIHALGLLCIIQNSSGVIEEVGNVLSITRDRN